MPSQAPASPSSPTRRPRASASVHRREHGDDAAPASRRRRAATTQNAKPVDEQQHGRPASATAKPTPIQFGSSWPMYAPCDYDPLGRRRASGSTRARPPRASAAERRPRERPPLRTAQAGEREHGHRRHRARTSAIAPSTCRKSGSAHESGRSSRRSRARLPDHQREDRERRRAPLPHESASVTGSRSRARSSALGASPSAASRSASWRVSPSRSPPRLPSAPATTQSTSEATTQSVAEREVGLVDEPEAEHERERATPTPISDDRDAGQARGRARPRSAARAAARARSASPAITEPPRARNAPVTCSASSHW